jgi:NDP-sugar pyrophosphorylase family protein
MNAPCGTDWPPRLALLAGGLGTRLGKLTVDTPKSLVCVAGEPFLGHQLRLLRAGGIREVVLCCGHLGSQIRSFAGDGSRFELSLRYSFDGESPLGTGGALRSALPLLGERFFVMYGDSWLTEPPQQVWNAFLQSKKPALMTVFRNQNRWGASNVEFRHGVIVRYGKAQSSPAVCHIDYGLEALDAAVLRRWTAERFDLEEVWQWLARQSLLAGYETAGRFYEIGSLPGLSATEAVITASARSIPNRHGDPPPQKAAQQVCR